MFTIQTKNLRIAVGAIVAMLAGFPACAQSLQEHTSTCFACHGEKGQSQLPEVPSLGAQPVLYTLVELVMFRDKLRITEPMNEMTKGLSDDDLRAVSDMIAKLPPPTPVSDNQNPPAWREGARLRIKTVAISVTNRIFRVWITCLGSPANARITCSSHYALTRTIHGEGTTRRCRKSSMR
jgi:cytochrome c553